MSEPNKEMDIGRRPVIAKIETRIHKNYLVRALFVLLGSVFFTLGVIGIFLPVLPTTPFVLLAAACWVRGSVKFHTWLIEHPTFGPLVIDWQDRRAIPFKAKLLAWTMMSLSCAMLFYRFSADLMWLAWLTLAICVVTAIWMARLPNA